MVSIKEFYLVLKENLKIFVEKIRKIRNSWKHFTNTLLLNNQNILNLLCVPESVPHSGVMAYPDGLVTVIESPVHCPTEAATWLGTPMSTVTKSSLIWQTSENWKDIQWTLDLRKILGETKIFLKSRFFLISSTRKPLKKHNMAKWTSETIQMSYCSIIVKCFWLYL